MISDCKKRGGGLLVSLVALAGLTLNGRAHAEKWPDREAVSAWLSHQEGLVSSAYCEYDLITVPTSKEQIARMRDYWRSFKREDQLERFIVSEQSAKEHGMS